MKLKTLSSAALIAVLTMGGFAPSALAVETELNSPGSVKVIEGGGEEIPGTVDPEDPDTFLPDPDPDGPDEITNPDLGALMIERTTELAFGEISTSANTVETFAKPMEFDGGSETRGAYVQWRDIRAGGTFGYTITAQLTKQFTGTTASNKLNGATVDFTNGIVEAQGGNTNVAPSGLTTAFQLTEATDDAKTVVNALKTNEEGKGRYIMEFGQSSTSPTGTPGTADKAVKLTVPGATASNMAVDDYTAEVTWKIIAAP